MNGRSNDSMALAGSTTLAGLMSGRIGRCMTGACVIVTSVIFAGCRPAGPQRYHISGTVTYGGQPVPAGAISFIPINAHDQDRGPGHCRFNSGRYESRRGRSPGSGPYRVLIDGYDGVPFESRLGDEIEQHPMGKPIFGTEVVEIDLPARHGGIFNFELPTQAAAKPTAANPGGR